MDTEMKVTENRLRRVASRQGLRLEKSRAKDHRATGYGTYQLVSIGGGDWRSNELIAGDQNTGYGLSLEEVERILNASGKPSIWKHVKGFGGLYHGPKAKHDVEGFRIEATWTEDKGAHFWGSLERTSEEYTIEEMRRIHRAIGKLIEQVTADPRPVNA